MKVRAILLASAAQVSLRKHLLPEIGKEFNSTGFIKPFWTKSISFLGMHDSFSIKSINKSFSVIEEISNEIKISSGINKLNKWDWIEF